MRNKWVTADEPILEAINRRRAGFAALATPWPSLNRYLEGGLAESSLLVIGGPSEAYKSGISQCLLWHWARQSLPCVYVDFENGPSRLASRFFQIAGYGPLSDAPSLTDEEDAVGNENALQRFKAFQEYVLDTLENMYLPDPRLIASPADFIDGMSYIRERHPDTFLPTVIDSLHKLPMDLTNERGGIDVWLRALERIKKDLNLPIIATSEIPRNYNRDDPFKASSGIKYTADLACIVDKCAGQMWFVKNRDGRADDRKFDYIVDYPNVTITAESEYENED